MLGHGSAPDEHGKRLDGLVGNEKVAALAHVGKVAQRLGGLEGDDAIGASRVGHHGLHARAPEAHDRGHRAAALRHAVDLGHLRVVTGFQRRMGQEVGRQDGALAAHAAQKDGDSIVRGHHATPPFSPAGCAMAFQAQYWAHWPHPMHWAASMSAWSFAGSFAMAGQPKVEHTPHAVQASVTA